MLQEFLQAAYAGFGPPEPVLPSKRLTNNNTTTIPNTTTTNNNNNTVVRQSLSAEKKKVGVDANVNRKSSPESTREKSDEGPVRLRQCCRSGCPNICLSTAPTNSR